MMSSYSSFDAWMRRIPDPLQVLLGLGAVAGLTAFKLTAGRSVTVIDFLFIPVVAVAWYARARWCGYAVALAAAASTVAVAMIAETQASFGAAAASGVARMGLYLVVLAFLGMMRRERARHQHDAATDETGAVNARTFRESAGVEVESARRSRQELSLAYIDLDDFKAINDRLGHPDGDRVLLEVSHVMRNSVRATDTVGRVGGDEFAILMPKTASGDARRVLDRVRDEIGRLRTADGESVRCSIGLVTFERAPASVDELLSAGDELLYRAKDRGKDRIAQGESSPRATARW